jgi:hypothetical protein
MLSSSANGNAENVEKCSPINNQSIVMGDDTKQAEGPIVLESEISPRRFRPSSDKTDAAFSNLKETLVETTKVLVSQTTLFLSPPTTSVSLTDAMVDETRHQTKQRLIFELLEVLRESEDDQEKLYSNHVLIVLQQLEIVPKRVSNLRDHFHHHQYMLEELQSYISTMVEDGVIQDPSTVKEIV